MQIWLHSDWHWRHQNIYKFTYKDAEGVEHRVRERFANAEEGDAFIAQAWAETVKPGDHVWSLGDLCMFENSHMGHELAKLYKSLPGLKRWIPGNHDKLHMKWYLECGFQKIRGSHLIDGVVLSHHPLLLAANDPHERRIGNAHGHIHQNAAPTPMHFNCCVEVTDYKPIAFEIVRDYFRKQQQERQP